MLCFATLGAATAPATTLERYRAALAEAVPAPFVSFEYSVEQTGVRDFQETHRIYRDATHERDELLSVNGEALSRPVVRLFRNRPDRYAIARIAPRAANYAFAYAGVARDGKRTGYQFATVPKVPGAFRIDRLSVDTHAFMPQRVQFTAKSGAVVGRGSVSFTKIERFWVPTVATITATVAGKPTREKIVWGRYRFPQSLPANVFTPPRRLPLVEPTPGAFGGP